jgi:hypothetical protein
VQRIRSALRGQGKWALLCSVALGLIISPFAIAGDGDVMRVGAGNSSQVNETRIIGQNVSTYATRQSNNKEGDGGSATYGCRSSIANEPCLFVRSLRTARAFEFRSRGNEGGRILVGDPTNPDNNRPFTTNATGVATGLNADEVDGRSADSLVARFAAVNANGTLAGGNGAASSSRLALGTYDVNFTAPVSGCAYTATITQYINSGAAAVQPQGGNTIRVRTRDGASAIADRPFHLVVNCP